MVSLETSKRGIREAKGLKEDIFGRLEDDQRRTLINSMLMDLLRGVDSPLMEQFREMASGKIGAIKARGQEEQGKVHAALAQRGGGSVPSTLLGATIPAAAERQTSGIMEDALTKGFGMTSQQLGMLQGLIAQELGLRIEAWKPMIQAQMAKAQGDVQASAGLLGGALGGLGGALGGALGG